MLLNGTWGNGLFTTGNAVGNVNASNQYVWATQNCCPWRQPLTRGMG